MTLFMCAAQTEGGDLDAKYYREHSALQYDLAQDPLNKYPFRGDEHVLDIGCGDGRVTAEISKKIPLGKIIGIDKSSSMIQLAIETFPPNQYPNLEFQQQDATHLAFEHEFDLITSFSCLHWILDQTAALKEIKKWLKPEGQAIIVTYPRCATFWDPIELVADSNQWKDYFVENPRPYSFLTESDYRRISNEIGLITLYSETTSHLAKFQGKSGFEAYVKGWLPFLLKLPPSLHQSFLEEIGDASLEYVPISHDGCVYHPYDKITLILENPADF